MSLNCGVIGLPNVGKSTLFNALTSTQNAQAANYPFCTIEPNKGIVDVPDSRLQQIAKISGSKTILPAKLEFVDIAGLVKGAHKGEGLGNQFLANIREVDAIIHVVRCFEDSNIIHVENSLNPVRDIEIINTELLIADLDSLEKRLVTLQKKVKGADKTALALITIIEKIIPYLQKGEPAINISFNEEEIPLVKQLFLLTYKPILYVCNIHENDINKENTYVQQVEHLANTQNAQCVTICAKIEQEISLLETTEEKQEFLQALNLKESGLDKIIKSAFQLLKLQTFFTAGPKETRAWTITIGMKAPEAAGTIHSDFERGFICAETISYTDFITYNGESKAKEMGKMHQEGKNYVVQDGDIILFRFNV
ncbi:Ribosome-binding ATPase YchF [Candidatus Hepatincola sp. Av]